MLRQTIQSVGQFLIFFAGTLGAAWQVHGRPPSSLEELLNWSFAPITIALIGMPAFFSLSRVPVGGRQVIVKNTDLNVAHLPRRKRVPSVASSPDRDSKGRFT